MKTNEQLESLITTLLKERDSVLAKRTDVPEERGSRHPDIPDSLIRAIVSAHVEEPDNPTIHLRVQQEIENTMGGQNASD